jgi:hypothetical protein
VTWVSRQLRVRRETYLLRETYGLPREVPAVVRIVILTVLCGIPLLVISWLASPSSPVVVAVVLMLELAIVFDGLRRVLTARTPLLDRHSVLAPSTRHLIRRVPDRPHPGSRRTYLLAERVPPSPPRRRRSRQARPARRERGAQQGAGPCTAWFTGSRERGGHGARSGAASIGAAVLATRRR